FSIEGRKKLHGTIMQFYHYKIFEIKKNTIMLDFTDLALFLCAIFKKEFYFCSYFIMIKLHYCSVKLFSSFNGEMTSGDFSSSSQHADQCVSDTSKCFGTYP